MHDMADDQRLSMQGVDTSRRMSTKTELSCLVCCFLMALLSVILLRWLLISLGPLCTPEPLIDVFARGFYDGSMNGSTSFESIFAALIPTTITAVIFVAIFVSIRWKYKNIYGPRTFLGTIPKPDRTPASSQTGSHWFHDYKSLNDKFVLRHQSLDGYLFLRFLRTIILICLVGCGITWPILLPVNATGGGPASQLDKLAFGNVDDNRRLYAHTVVAWVFLAFIVLLVTREQLFLIGMQQAYFGIKPNVDRLSSRVVLFLFAPDHALRREQLHETFGKEAQLSWVVSDRSKLEALVAERDDRAMTLENAQVALCKDASKLLLKRDEHGQTTGASADIDAEAPEVPDQSRPKHRLTPLIGKKVDTIDWGRRTLPELQDNIEERRLTTNESIKSGQNAIFVAYSNPVAAQRAYQTVELHGLVSKLTPDRFIAVEPEEVLWSNLTLSSPSRIARATLAIALILATTVFWAIPIGVVGAISNISYLTQKVKFLRFLNQLPPSVIGLISGLLPPLAISTLVSYVPKIFRYIAKLSGEATTPRAELQTQKWYFIFQVIQVFLVTALSSGAAAVATAIMQNPGSAPSLLASRLPLSSNFYLTYFVLQGIGSAANNLLNYSDLIEYLIYDHLLDKTPRDKYNTFISLKNINWGFVFPKFANFAVIAITYSCIAPLMLGFASVGVWLFYLSYRYNLLYTLQCNIDTRGECYGLALQHILTGVYFSEVCLIGLFGAREAPGPTTLMIILLVATAVYHRALNYVLSSVRENVAAGAEEDTVPLLAAEEGVADERPHSPESSQPMILGLSWLPLHISERIVDVVTDSIDRSRKTAKSWMTDPSARLDVEDAHYSDEELKSKYLNPAQTSKIPKLWLARDDLGFSKREISLNEAAGIPSSDEGAFLDSENHVQWAQDDFSKIPIFKEPVRD